MPAEFRPPYRVEVTDRAADLQAAHVDLDDGANSGVTATVAGRVMLLRHMGGRTFATLRDSSGSVQLMATAQETDDYKDITALNLGDWIVATGEVIRSRRGELSVLVDRWQLLAEARRGFGDKWRGITDTDLRYRQRYADLWANDDSRRVFLARTTAAAAGVASVGLVGYGAATALGPPQVLQVPVRLGRLDPTPHVAPDGRHRRHRDGDSRLLARAPALDAPGHRPTAGRWPCRAPLRRGGRPPG